MKLSPINSVYNNTTNSYKFYWWLSIIEICALENKTTISFEEIILKVISKVWYPVNYFKLSFGVSDQLAKRVKQVQLEFGLKDQMKEDDLYKCLIDKKNHKLLTKITSDLTAYVPYRFIRPWYNKEVSRLKDAVINSRILELQNNPKITAGAPYKINNNEIIISEDWANWICTHYLIIKAFTNFELLKYLEKKNPQTLNLSKKLEKTLGVRVLTTPTKYWLSYIEKNPNKLDVFENKPFKEMKSVSIDHFLPWSFLTHNLLWNLHPVTRNINSSKNNSLPHKDYLNPFYDLQYDFCNFLFSNEKSNKVLESYFIFFKCSKEELKNISKEEFSKRIDNYYQPQFEIAKNMGFSCDWQVI